MGGIFEEICKPNWFSDSPLATWLVVSAIPAELPIEKAIVKKLKRLISLTFLGQRSVFPNVTRRVNWCMIMDVLK